ncbi:MAG: hypothetical protein AAF570_00680, partial [Bacteroidota bacterium]
EKACRGLNPSLLNEYAWGSTSIIEVTQISAPEDGTEIAITTNANAHYQNNAITGGDGGVGPVRCGIFATPLTTTRDAAGATYYGVMEMSGNLWEPCVSVRNETSTSGAVAFDGTPGDGNVNAGGLANVTGWPSVAGTTQGWIRRGGNFATNTSGAVVLNLRVSDRAQLNWNGGRDQYTGGRGGR